MCEKVRSPPPTNVFFQFLHSSFQTRIKENILFHALVGNEPNNKLWYTQYFSRGGGMKILMSMSHKHTDRHTDKRTYYMSQNLEIVPLGLSYIQCVLLHWLRLLRHKFRVFFRESHGIPRRSRLLRLQFLVLSEVPSSPILTASDARNLWFAFSTMSEQRWGQKGRGLVG